MIQCIINGKVGYPDSNTKIRVTYENQYINDSGSYTYQITFPMSILANKHLFKNVSRFDIRKSLPEYEDCRLYVDNRLVICGKGTVMGVTNDAVKLQIIGSKSRIKYNSRFSSHYLDEIEFPKLPIETSEYNEEIEVLHYYNLSKTEPLVRLGAVSISGMIEISILKSHIVGKPGEWCFNPIYDETNGIIANAIFVNSDGKSIMYNLAVQPYLMYVLKYVLAFEGYTIIRNDIDKEPWNRLVIANARKTLKIQEALPHWSVYNFLEEIRKLFNVSFIFEEEKRTVSIIGTDELTYNDNVSYECEDAFTCEKDETGLKNIATSNIQYDFVDSANRGIADVIPQSVLKKFKLIALDNYDEFLAITDTMTKKEKMTTVFLVGDDYNIFEIDEDKYNDKEAHSISAGFFTPLIRDEDSDEFENLRIHPVAMAFIKRWNDGESKWLKESDCQDKNLIIFVPSIVNDKEADLNSMSFDDEEDEYYISVKDALENTDLIEQQEEDDVQHMQIMFQSKTCFNYKENIPEDPVADGEGIAPAHRYPTVYTDYRMAMWIHKKDDTASLSLKRMRNSEAIGNMESTLEIDKNNLICIKFFTDEIPDPTKIFIFRNKRYICKKVEMEVGQRGIAKAKTGYFYEFY